MRIFARNMDTAEERLIADNGASNHRPSTDGDLIAYESNLPGNLDIFVYRLSTGETFQVTDDPADQYLNDVFGQSVTYVDQRAGNEDIYVSDLVFVHVPDPVLEVTGREDTPSGEFTRYYLSVTNWDAIPDALFEPAPDLPPCGSNTNASRTWVSIYRQDDSYMYGFCNLDSPEDLTGIWFSVPKGQEPPEYVYITLWDRRYDITYTSNLAWTNLKPLANAGTDQTVHIGSSVTLDGSGSSDPDNNYPLTYSWTITSAPNGSTAALSDQTAVNPSFVADMMGDYMIEVTVTDSLGLSSTADSVLVSTYNTPPVADAGPDQAVIVLNTTVQLDGTASYDLEGDPITFAWTMTQKPVGSTAALSNPASPTPTFVADKQGSYEIQLVASDPWTQSSPDTVTVSFENIKPVADAGTGQSIEVGETVTLNGSGSSDANGDPLTYTWALVSVPDGSLSSITDPTAEITTFVPDLPGTYVVQLIVNDGFVDSDPSTIQVQVVTVQTVIIKAVQDLETVITSLNPDVFKNANMQNTLINKLNAVIANIEAGNYAGALGQLQNDILGKTDGCATSGAPDKNDWIKDCEAQNQVYPLIMEVIELVRRLI